MTNSELFRTIRRWAAENCPGIIETMSLKLKIHKRGKITIQMPGEAADQEEEFTPNEMQLAILEVLEGKAIKTSELCRLTGYGSSTVFRKKGGMAQLQEAGMVKHCPRGFYRPDCPPDDIS